MDIKSRFKEIFKKNLEDKIVYYPYFDSSDELTNHYYRACWYFPKEKNHCGEVDLYIQKKVILQEKPEYMGATNVSKDHIKIKEDISRLVKAAETAKVVLIWKKCEESFIEKLKSKGVTVINIATNDEDAIEYGRYCDLIWRYFKTDGEKKKIIQDSYNKFIKYADKIKETGKRTGCVFGTGPSLETADEFDFSDCISVVCNSIVQNKELLSRIRPQFITAGDVVSHLGVSLYAEVFRKDLVDYLKNSDAYYLTTAPFGYILLEQCPEVAHKIILVEQIVDEQNYDLTQLFGLPKLDSTFNIHMLPIIHTFCDNIFILGCDGKSKTRNNEDFWAHAQEAQYFDLVDTGHKCHPTFDINRKKSTYSRYQDSVLHSVIEGEKRHEKKYYTLQQSYIEALEDKKLPDELRKEYNKDGQLVLSKVLGNRQEQTVDNEEIKENIKVTREGDKIFLSGWVLSKNPCMVEIYVDHELHGYAVKNVKRPDILKKYGEYKNLFAGIYYYIDKTKETEIEWHIVSKEGILKSEKMKV